MSLSPEDLEALRPMIATAVKEVVYGESRLQPQLDSPSQKQFRKRLGVELPHVYKAIQQHLDDTIARRVFNLELAYKDLAQLCQTLIEMVGEKPISNSESLVIPSTKIVIPGRE